MTIPAFRAGDRVAWGGASQPYINEKTGVVAQVIPAGQNVTRERLPESERHGQLLAEGMARNHVSYVVRVGSKLYWPRVASLRAVVAGADAPEPAEVALARRRIGEGWNMADRSAPMEDALALLAEVDRLRGLLAGGSR